MAFEVSNTGYKFIDPLFAPGYDTEVIGKYHNVGQLQTPYQGKKMGVLGDYAPPQKTKYYTDYNRTYPYVMDANFRAAEYLPTEGCCFRHPGYFPCYNGSYPDIFIPSNYFSPQLKHPYGHAKPSLEGRSGPASGTALAFPQNIREECCGRNIEHFGQDFEHFGQNLDRAYHYTRLPFSYPGIRGANDFYPFGKNRY